MGTGFYDTLRWGEGLMFPSPSGRGAGVRAEPYSQLNTTLPESPERITSKPC